MGVINLGVLVEALKKKLAGTFVKTTDYASKTKYGIVKIGDGITVSSGKISVAATGGMTEDLLYTGTVALSSNYIEAMLAHNWDDYKMLVFYVGTTNANSVSCGMFMTSCVSTGALQDNNIQTAHTNVKFRVVLDNDAIVKNKLSVACSSSANVWKIIGIK